tara:strand:- start:2420 stop:2569 length:150 start_codon:yes stop_codon:yes gene_type:complete
MRTWAFIGRAKGELVNENAMQRPLIIKRNGSGEVNASNLLVAAICQLAA